MKRTIIHWQLPGRSEPQACAVRTVADDDALQRDAERLAEAERALRHVLSSAQTGTYDGGVVISFAALSAVRAVTPESASFQPSPARCDHSGPDGYCPVCGPDGEPHPDAPPRQYWPDQSTAAAKVKP